MDYNYYKNTAIGLLWGLLLCALLSTLGGCKTKYVSVPEYHKEYFLPHRHDKRKGVDDYKRSRQYAACRVRHTA